MNQTPEMDEKKTSSPETAPIAATAEHNANFEENIRAIIRSGKPASVIRDDLDNYHANDIAEVLETLDTATRKRLYNILSLEMTAEIFTYLDEPAPYLHELGLDRAAAVLAEMDADEAVDILFFRPAQRRRTNNRRRRTDACPHKAICAGQQNFHDKLPPVFKNDPTKLPGRLDAK